MKPTQETDELAMTISWGTFGVFQISYYNELLWILLYFFNMNMCVYMDLSMCVCMNECMMYVHVCACMLVRAQFWELVLAFYYVWYRVILILPIANNNLAGQESSCKFNVSVYSHHNIHAITDGGYHIQFYVDFRVWTQVQTYFWQEQPTEQSPQFTILYFQLCLSIKYSMGFSYNLNTAEWDLEYVGIFFRSESYLHKSEDLVR